MKISAKVVADSVANNIRITTLELCYHRFIHSEFMTHRMFSRNASSSRAIPIGKMLKQVHDTPAMPIHWGKNHPGMQARDSLAGVYVEEAMEEWYYAIHKMIERVDILNSIGLHKQVINRLLEPFQYIKVIVTATEWDNFFKLRNHPDAQPEMQELARCMKEAMDHSIPVVLGQGKWHLPYVKNEDTLVMSCYGNKEDLLSDMIKCSVARCARVSYLNHDTSGTDVSKDIALADKLLEAGHMSCFEHQATPRNITPLSESPYYTWQHGVTHQDRNGDYWSNNFRGWIQYRALLNDTM